MHNVHNYVLHMQSLKVWLYNFCFSLNNYINEYKELKWRFVFILNVLVHVIPQHHPPPPSLSPTLRRSELHKNVNNKKTPEGVYAGWIGWSKNYVEWGVCLIKTRNGEMIKWRNGETILLKVRAKVVRCNPSNRIIERINKRTQQSRFLFQFVLVTLHICAALQSLPCIHLIHWNIQRHSVSVQSTCLPNIMYKIHRAVGSILIIHFMRLLKLRA